MGKMGMIREFLEEMDWFKKMVLKTRPNLSYGKSHLNQTSIPPNLPQQPNMIQPDSFNGLMNKTQPLPSYLTSWLVIGNSSCISKIRVGGHSFPMWWCLF